MFEYWKLCNNKITIYNCNDSGIIELTPIDDKSLHIEFLHVNLVKYDTIYKSDFKSPEGIFNNFYLKLENLIPPHIFRNYWGGTITFFPELISYFLINKTHINFYMRFANYETFRIDDSKVYPIDSGEETEGILLLPNGMKYRDFIN